MSKPCERHVYCYRSSFCPSRVCITCQCCGANYFAEMLRKHEPHLGRHLHAFCKLDNGHYQCRIWNAAESRRCELTLHALPTAEPPCRKTTDEQRLAIAVLAEFIQH